MQKELSSSRVHPILTQRFLQFLLGSVVDLKYNPEPREVSTNLSSSSVKWEMYAYLNYCILYMYYII